MEEEESLEPSQDYLKGFNQGYYLRKTGNDELIESISKSNAPVDYLDGFSDAGMEYEKSRILEELQMREDERALNRNKDRGIER